ncbi:MAG: hypothetical protein QM648_10600 [Solirubrobacterales bacterium]
MNFPDLDTTDYNRTLASIGVALIVLGIVAPWLVLRDTSALTVSIGQLHDLTPDARDIIVSRQSQIRIVQSLWPFFSVPAVVLGSIMLGWSVVRIRALQPHRDKLVIATGLKAEAEWNRQTASEIVQNIEDERKLESALNPGADAVDLEESRAICLPGESERLGDKAENHEGRIPGVAFDFPVGSQVQLEERALDAIAAKLSDGFDLWKHAKLEIGDGGIFIDGLVINVKGPSVLAVVEVKTIRYANALAPLVDSALAQLLRINDAFRVRERFPTIANGWIVMVVPDESSDVAAPSSRFARIRALAERIDTGPAILTIVRESDLDEIELPRGLVAEDRAVFDLREIDGPIPSPA